jgi:hypothetical protein
MMAANGESMGKSTSTKPNIQGTFFFVPDGANDKQETCMHSCINLDNDNLDLQELLQMHLQAGTRLQSNKDGAAAR